MLTHDIKYLKKQKGQLTDTTQNFFHLLEQFAKLKKTKCMNILILENTIKNLVTSTCGLFQLYFYKNLFDPDKKSKILNHQTLNKNTLETIINEVFQLILMKMNILLQTLKKNMNCNNCFCF